MEKKLKENLERFIKIKEGFNESIERLTDTIHMMLTDEELGGLHDIVCKVMPELGGVNKDLIEVRIFFEYGDGIDYCSLSSIKETIGACDIWVHTDKRDEIFETNKRIEGKIWLSTYIPFNLEPVQKT